MTERERRLREYEERVERAKEREKEEAKGAAAAVGTLGVAAKVSGDVASEARKARRVEKNREILDKKANTVRESGKKRSAKTKYTGKHGTVKSVDGLKASGTSNMGKHRAKIKKLNTEKDTTPKKYKVKNLKTKETFTMGDFHVKAKNTRAIGNVGTARHDLREAKRSYDTFIENKDKLYNDGDKMSKGQIKKTKKAMRGAVKDSVKSGTDAAKKSVKPAINAAKGAPAKIKAGTKVARKAAGRGVAKAAATGVGKAAVKGIVPGVGVALTAMEVADLVKSAKKKKEIERRQRAEEEKIRRGINLQ